MNHEEFRELLSALLDGELEDAEREKALSHLEECEECRGYYAELASIHTALSELEPERAPEGFAEGVMARLHEKEAPKKTVRTAPWRGWAALAACAAVVVIAVSVTNNGKKTSGAVMEAAVAAEAPAAMMESSEESAAITGSMMMTAGDAAEADEYAGVDMTESANLMMTAPSASGAPEDKEGLREAELLLYGEDAEFWLWNNGEWDESQEGYWVDRETLKTLPEGLSLGTPELVAHWNSSDRTFAFVRAADSEAAR